MSVAAIICEYNLFHNGHAYQIKKTRELLGENTEIIAIMSGNFTQRGECAIMDKSHRAKIATEAGINLVLELPFPYSMSSAEFFAASGVHILNALGCVDYLVFGSECGDVEILKSCAEVMLSRDFKSKLAKYARSKDYKTLGYPELIEAALQETNSNKAMPELTPNNILAVEYIKALLKTKSKIMPFTIKRIGARYNSENIERNELQSASAIRNAIIAKDISALEYTPTFAKDITLELLSRGEFPCDISRLDSAVISHFRLNSQAESCDIHDVGGGLYNSIRSASFKANDYTTLLRLLETKAFTRARLRRAILYSFFGVTSSDVKDLPRYTQILALDNIGMALLKKIRKQSGFPILTKPSKTDGLSEGAKRQKLLSDKADSIYQLTKPCPPDGNSALRLTPYVKK